MILTDRDRDRGITQRQALTGVGIGCGSQEGRVFVGVTVVVKGDPIYTVNTFPKDDGVNGVNVLLVGWQEKDVIRVPITRQADESFLQVLVRLVKH